MSAPYQNTKRTKSVTFSLRSASNANMRPALAEDAKDAEASVRTIAKPPSKICSGT